MTTSTTTIIKTLYKLGYLSEADAKSTEWAQPHQAAWAKAVHTLRTDLPYDTLVLYAESQPNTIDVIMARLANAEVETETVETETVETETVETETVETETVETETVETETVASSRKGRNRNK